jgi:amino acid adenylation domain-containing protein
MGIDNLTARLADLSPAKRVLLELRLKQRALDSGLKQTMSRRRITSSAPLSFSQQRLWFLDQYEPNSSIYNVASALRLQGRLNLAVLQQSLNEIVRRHEILRTTFSMLDREPIQVIALSLMVSVPVIDLRDHPEGEREQEAQELATKEARRPFDLAQGPLFRSKLLRLGEDDYVLLLAMHHIVSDGWSMGVFYRELSLLYGAFSHGEPNPLEDLAIQYADFVVWQREWLQGEVLEKQLSYWKNQLEGIPGVLDLPTDRPRPAVQSYRGKRQSIELSKELTEGLKALSRKESVTLFMTLLAAFQTLLYRYTGQKDIVVGSPIANRNRTEIEGLIGFFVNTLVLRTSFSGNPTFKELLAQVRETALGAYAHQDLPFEKLVEELQQRSLSHSPLFQVMFVLQNAPGESLNFERLSVSRLGIGAKTAKFDLTLSMSESVDGLKGSLQYNTDLFDAETIIRMLGHFRVLLEGVVANPNQRLARLPVLTQAEQHQLLVDWNVTKRDYPKDKCIHELFEAQVERSPDAVAVVFESRQLTYRELNRKANQLAHYLRKHGVGAEVLVAICMERSLEMLVGLLGILKAGGAYVPLDPDCPKERLGFMLEDIQTSVLLSQERLITHLPESCARVVCLDRDWKTIAEQSGENPISATTPESLAYVIYTSGSTGQPKGVEVSHRGVLRLLFGVEYVQLNESETFLHLAPISFDASTFELWGSLLHGAKCVLFPGKIPSPHELGNILHHHGISALWLTASLFNTVIDEAPEALSGVRQLLIGGEALSVPHVGRAVALLPQTQIINGYGPTESTTFACCYRIPARLDESMNSIPIGRPIANTEVYLLDSHLSPVPIGAPGELYIGGDGLARSYLNRPDLTAENFIAHPFGDEPGARLYKTGDLARYLSDGNIEFLGRIDDQVKIRGFRIELGEIESVLGQHPAVHETVVLAREDTPGTKRLVAYVVPVKEQACSTSELRNFVKQKLPEYMIPFAFVLLDLLPLTANGKVDRKLFPPPDQNRPELEPSYAAPRTSIEERLAEIWSKLLGLNQVGIRDNFFDLGGHSLLAVRLLTEIENAFKQRLPLSCLFKDGTIEHLAKIIDHKTPSGKQSCLVPIQPSGDKIPFFCVHEFFGDVLCYMNLVRHLGLDQPFYGIEARGLDGVEEPFADLKTMAAYYVDLIRTIRPHGPYALGGLCFGGLVAFEMAQQLLAKGEAVSIVALLDSGIKTGSGTATRWWRRFEVAAKGLPSWLAGALELNGSQWLDLIKLKQSMVKAKFGARNGNSHASKLINEMANLFGFSERHRKVAHAQHRAMRNYRPKVYPGQLTLFRARMQPLFSSHKPDKGWGRLAAGGIEIRVVPGNHLGMLQEPHVKILAKELRACLDKRIEVDASSKTPM